MKIIIVVLCYSVGIGIIQSMPPNIFLRIVTDVLGALLIIAGNRLQNK